MENKKIGIVIDNDFASKNNPPYPRPMFLSYENPNRIKGIISYFEKIHLFEDDRIIKLAPMEIDEEIVQLAHSKYYIDSIKRLSNLGSGLMGDEVFITKDTFNLAKKAIGGAIRAVESVIKNDVNQSFALIRPPGHHALREMGSGLCIFNNIANTILYLRKILKYEKKIAIIDIDDHLGDGIVRYFYNDPSVLYFSVHEFDFVEGELGFPDELGEGEGLGKNINFPVPAGVSDNEFLEFFDILDPILREYQPDLIIIATGFDFYFDDPLGNGNLTSISYFNFAERILRIADEVCEGKIAFILEGGYSLIGLPFCVHAIIKGLLNEHFELPLFENLEFRYESKMEEIIKIKNSLKELLKNH
ncbi:MAG: histone deacetylase, partial [Promethearchaeota archaeon]